MSAPSLLLIGAGGHADSVIDVIETEGRFQIAGLIDAQLPVGSQRLGYSCLGRDEDLPTLAGRFSHALVTIGQIKSAEIRRRLYRELEQLGFILPTVLSPTAHVSRHARLGPGTVVMHGAIVNAQAVIGANCILNSRCLIEHGTQVGDHCHIATGAILNGDCRIGEGSFIGSGSVLKQGISVGRNSVVAFGQRLAHTIGDRVLYRG